MEDCKCKLCDVCGIYVHNSRKHSREEHTNKSKGGRPRLDKLPRQMKKGKGQEKGNASHGLIN